MTIHPRAGTLAPAELLVDVGTLRNEYYRRTPDVTERSQRVKFGTSGHRGSSLLGTFTEAHVIAIDQGDLRLPTLAAAFQGRSTSAATHTRCPSRHS